FFSERYWRTYFDRPPPGIMGAGSGVGLGQVFPGPLRTVRPGETPASLAWTRKDFYAEWDFVVDDAPSVPYEGGPGASHGREGWTLTTESMQEHEEKTLAHLVATDPVARAQIEAKVTAELLQTPDGKAKLEAYLATAAGQERLAEYLASEEGRDTVLPGLDVAIDASDESAPSEV
ncbi:MAG: hypothetical protein GX643_13140, partial [Acidimicrobiales bacterium]|nr:hypothetical protein [Acidimicrobiales bacterium]